MFPLMATAKQRRGDERVSLSGYIKRENLGTVLEWGLIYLCVMIIMSCLPSSCVAERYELSPFLRVCFVSSSLAVVFAAQSQTEQHDFNRAVYVCASCIIHVIKLHF